MIEFQNQFKMMFSIGKYKDFLSEPQLEVLKLIERCGNVLPEFEIQFKIANTNIFKVLNETNRLEMSWGVSEIQLDIPLIIYKKRIVTNSFSEYTVTAAGLLAVPNYLFTPKKRTWGNAMSDGRPVSGLEIIAAAAKDSFSEVESNIQTSQDYMLRIQYGISNKKFIDEVWHTLYTPDTFIGLGITSAGKFKMRDIKALSSTEPAWNFTYTPKNPARDISYKGDAILDDESGLNNYLFGYIRQQEFYDEDSGDTYISQTGNSTMLSLSQNFNRDNIIMTNPQTARNDNMYTEYWEANMTNLSNLALFSSVQYQIQFQPCWYPVEILDLVTLMCQGQNGQPEEAFSGLYLVTTVSRVFQKRKVTTVVGLNREGFNRIF